MNKREIVSLLDDENIDELLKYVPEYSEKNSTNIKNKFYKKIKTKSKPRFKRPSIIAASIALTVVLSSSLVYAGVKTGIIDLNAIYTMVFGDKADYISQYAEIIEGSSEYDGIKLDLISAIKDESKLITYFTLTDLTGDRLSDSMDLNNSWSLDQGTGGNCRLLTYDENTKTATFQITSYGASTNKTATLNIKSFLKSLEFKKDLVENDLDIYSLTDNNEAESVPVKNIIKGGYSTGSSPESKYCDNKEFEKMNVLKQDALSIPFSTIDWIKISNIGFVDGELHIQTTLEDDCFNNLMSLSFVDENNNKVHDSLFSVGYGRSSVDLNTGLAKYYEFVFEGINNLSQIKDLKLSLDIAEYGQHFEGKWEAKFKVPAEAKKIEIPVSDKLKISGEEITVDKMILSPLDVTIYYKSNNTDMQNNDDVLYVTYKDGSVINLTFLSKGTDTGNVTYKFSGEVIKIEDIKSININGIELLVE